MAGLLEVDDLFQMGVSPPAKVLATPRRAMTHLGGGQNSAWNRTPMMATGPRAPLSPGSPISWKSGVIQIDFLPT